MTKRDLSYSIKSPIPLSVSIAVIVAIVACGILAASTDPRAWLLIRNSLLLAVGCGAIALPVGSVLAVLLFRTDLPGRKLFLLTFGSLLFLPLYLQVAGWDAGFGRQGWFSMSHGSVAAPLLDGWRAAILVHGVAAVPWVLLIVGLGLRYIEPDLEEAALLEGSAGLVLATVTARRVLPFVGVAALWIMVSTGTEITVTDLYRVRTFAEEIYVDVPFAAAISPLEPLNPTTQTSIALVICLVLITMTLSRQLAPPDQVPNQRRPWTFRLGGMRWFAAGGVLMVAALSVGLPLGNLVYKAGLVVEQVGGERVRDWSALAFAKLLADSPWEYADELWWTLVISGLAAGGSLALAVPLAWLARRSSVGAMPALTIATACLALPGPMVGLAVIWLLNRRDWPVLVWLYDRTIFAPWLTMLVKALPVAIFTCWHLLRTVPDEELDSAATEGAGWLRQLWRIGLTRYWPALAAIGLGSMAIAAGDLAASVLVFPPGITTASVRVFGLLHSGVDDQVAGLCLTLMAWYVVLTVVVFRLAQWPAASERSRRELDV